MEELFDMPPDMMGEMPGGQPAAQEDQEDVFGFGAAFGDMEDDEVLAKPLPQAQLAPATPDAGQENEFDEFGVQSEGGTRPPLVRDSLPFRSPQPVLSCTGPVQEDRSVSEAPPPKRRRIRGKTAPSQLCGG